MLKKEKFPKDLCGAAGQYFVAAELSRRGYTACLTLRNTQGIDILVSNRRTKRAIGVQVKTRRATPRKKWPVGLNAEHLVSENTVFIFVNLNEPHGPPEYHIVPSKDVWEFVETQHEAWKRKLRKDGRPHGPNKFRSFRDPDNKYRDRWELLGLDLILKPS